MSSHADAELHEDAAATVEVTSHPSLPLALGRSLVLPEALPEMVLLEEAHESQPRGSGHDRAVPPSADFEVIELLGEGGWGPSTSRPRMRSAVR